MTFFKSLFFLFLIKKNVTQIKFISNLTKYILQETFCFEMACLNFFMFLAIAAAWHHLTQGTSTIVDPRDIQNVILNECYLGRGTSPLASNEKFSIGTMFGMTKFSSVDDVNQVIKVNGYFGIVANMPCVKRRAEYYSQNQSVFINDIWVITATDDFWRPGLGHENG